MRIRIVTALASAGTALGLVAVVLLGLAVNGVLLNPPDDSVGSLVAMDKEPDPEPSGQPEVIPPTDAELASMAEHEQFTVQCMIEAGFPGYVEQNVWDTDYEPVEDWDADFTDAQAAAAFIALWGDTGAGSDYRWQDAGCKGYATHMIGADLAN